MICQRARWGGGKRKRGWRWCASVWKEVRVSAAPCVSMCELCLQLSTCEAEHEWEKVSQHEGQRLCLCCPCVHVRMCTHARQETVVSLALQCLLTGNVCPGKTEEILPPHMANTGTRDTHADVHRRTCRNVHTHARLQRAFKKKEKEKKEESDERSSLCGEVWYLVLGKWEWLGWARPVLYFPPPWLPTQAPADRKSIRWPPLNLCEWAQGLTALSTLMHTNWPTSLLQLLFLLLPLR